MTTYRCSKCIELLAADSILEQSQIDRKYQRVRKVKTEEFNGEHMLKTLKEDSFLYSGEYCFRCNKVFCSECSKTHGEVCVNCGRKSLVPAFRLFLKGLKSLNNNITMILWTIPVVTFFIVFFMLLLSGWITDEALFWLLIIITCFFAMGSLVFIGHDMVILVPWLRIKWKNKKADTRKTLEEKLDQLSDEELLLMLKHNRRIYTKEVVKIARCVTRKRGGHVSLERKTEKYSEVNVPCEKCGSGPSIFFTFYHGIELTNTKKAPGYTEIDITTIFVGAVKMPVCRKCLNKRSRQIIYRQALAGLIAGYFAGISLYLAKMVNADKYARDDMTFMATLSIAGAIGIIIALFMFILCVRNLRHYLNESIRDTALRKKETGERIAISLHKEQGEIGVRTEVNPVLEGLLSTKNSNIDIAGNINLDTKKKKVYWTPRRFEGVRDTLKPL